jgi:hypothetical protein
MTRAVNLANLADSTILSVDAANDRVGIGSTQPTEKLDVVGVVSATSFFGDGSNLSGITAGATLSAASGAQRVVVTSLTSGTMTAAGTDADLAWNSTTNTLSATNISVGGTLTYEDVTNVDSIGVITARSGIIVSGVGTFTDSAKIGTSASSALSDRVLSVGDVARSATYIEVRTSTSGASGVVFSDGVDSSDTGYRGTIEYAHSSDQLTFKAGGVTRVTIDGTGNMGATGNVSDSKGNLRRLDVAQHNSNYTLVAADAGRLLRDSAGSDFLINQDIFSAGDMISIFNASSSNTEIQQGSGVTLINSADAATGTRTMAPKGMCTVVCTSSNEFVISGSQLS